MLLFGRAFVWPRLFVQANVCVSSFVRLILVVLQSCVSLVQFAWLVVCWSICVCVFSGRAPFLHTAINLS